MDDCRNGEQNTILADVQWLYEHRLATRHLAWVKAGHSNSRIPQHDSRINTYNSGNQGVSLVSLAMERLFFHYITSLFTCYNCQSGVVWLLGIPSRQYSPTLSQDITQGCFRKCPYLADETIQAQFISRPTLS